MFLNDDLLNELYKKTNELFTKIQNSSYSESEGEKLFNWIHNNIIVTENTISSGEKLNVKVKPNDMNLFDKVFKIIRKLDSKTGTNDKSLHTLFGEFNKIKNNLLV